MAARLSLATLCVLIASLGCVESTAPRSSLAPTAVSGSEVVRAETQPAALVTRESPPRMPFFPEVNGDRWRYRSDVVLRRVRNGVELPPLTTSTVYEEVVRRSRPTAAGTVFELLDPVAARFETPVYRQDASGLCVHYEAFAVNASVVPDDVAIPSYQGESIVLKFPLHTGQRWAGRWGEEWIVEGVEVLDLAPGRMVTYRVKNGTAVNWSRNWYGPCGRVRSERHTEDPVLENGQTVGLDIYRKVDVLESLDLVDCHRCTACGH